MAKKKDESPPTFSDPSGAAKRVRTIIEKNRAGTGVRSHVEQLGCAYTPTAELIKAQDPASITGSPKASRDLFLEAVTRCIDTIDEIETDPMIIVWKPGVLYWGNNYDGYIELKQDIEWETWSWTAIYRNSSMRGECIRLEDAKSRSWEALQCCRAVQLDLDVESC